MSVKKKSPLQRIMSMLLCVAMLMSLATPVWATETDIAETDTAETEPVETEPVETETTDTTAVEETDSGISALGSDVEYVSLPITIRDFAADGMLFEFNQVNLSSQSYAPWKTYEFLSDSLNTGFTWGTNDNCGFRIRTYAVYGTALPDSYDWWYCVICSSDGSIKKILPPGTGSKTEYATYMTEGCHAIWLWIADETTDGRKAQRAIYNEFVSLVNEDTKHRYHITYDAASATMTVGVEYLEYNGKKYILGDNNGFTLLLTDSSDYVNNLADDSSIPGSNVVQNNTNGTTPPESVTVTLNSGAPQYVNAGNMRLDLVTAELDGDKKPVYTEATVAYLADLLQTMLQVPYTVELGGETYYMGYYILGDNLFDKDFIYVGQDSEAAQYGLADVLRSNINSGLGSYADSKEKFEAGNLCDPANADTYFDAAYYLLHSTWRDGTLDAKAPGSDGYGWNTWNYDKINLIQTTNENGEKCYVFNSGYDDVEYDYYWAENGSVTGTGSIYNTQVETITPAKNKPTDANGNYIGTDVYSNGIVLPNARFDPLGQSGSGLVFGYGQKAGIYCEMMNSYPDRGEIFYPETNYHLSLEGHAKFIYYAEANQYFTFTGDDDVYLYINGKRVLDLGGAHAIAEVSINLNDVAELCGLSDGMTYDFDFYYMERHGTAANFGIETNIQIVDPSMLTTKTGYQNGQNTGYNGLVAPNRPVVYEFGLENNGEAAINNLTFTDGDIGVALTKDSIKLNSLTNIADLSVTLYGKDGEVKSSVAAGSLTESALKTYLETGLEVGEKLVIHGFNYMIGSDEWECRYVDANGNGQYDDGEQMLSNWYFFNVVYTSATSVGENNSTRELTGTSNWVVQQGENSEPEPVPDPDPNPNKYVSATDDPNAFELTLEAYVEGETSTITKTTPADIILVLDQSASMFSPAGGANDYTNDQPYTLTNKLSAADILADKENAAHLGYYVAQSHGGRPSKDEDGNSVTYYDWFIVQYDAEEDVWYYVRASHTAEAVNLDTSVELNAITNKIGETIKRSEPFGDSNGFVYYKSQYGALYDSINSFVDGIRDTGVKHRVAVVGFASPFYDGWVNYDGTGIYLDGEYYLYDTDYLYQDENGIYSPDVYYASETNGQKEYLDQSKLNFKNVSEVYDKALVDISTAAGYSSVKASVSAVTSNYRHTCPAAGLEIANNIFDQTPAEGRDRIVVLFTDGVPTVTTQANYGNAYDYAYGRDAYWNVAQGKNQAMEMAYKTKHTYGAEIYTIGTASVAGDPFLDGVSSDYPNAKSYPTADDNDGVVRDEETVAPADVYKVLGDPIEGAPKYTTYVSTEAELNNIFHSIMETTTTVSVDLGENAILRDVLTDYFELNPEDSTAVSVYTADYLGNGSFAAPVEVTEDMTVEVSSSTNDDRMDTIEVSGFDYAANYVAEATGDGEAARGKKLIVKIQIKTREGFWGGNNVPTNDDDTGLYPGGDTPPIEFPEPEVNVPIDVTIDAKDIVIYYGGDVSAADLLNGITAGGETVDINPITGNLTPKAEWMDDYATLVWTSGSAKPGTTVSNKESSQQTFSVTLLPNSDGQENESDNPANIVGTPVVVTGQTVTDTGTVKILVPILTFGDSTIDYGYSPNHNYYEKTNRVGQVKWVDKDDITQELQATDPSTEPTLTLTYTPNGTIDGSEHFTSDTKIEVTVESSNVDGAAGDITNVSYFDWETCDENLHKDEQTPITLHKGDASTHEFWLHVPEETEDDNGLVTDKYVDEVAGDPNKFKLTLEAYAKGQVTEVTGTKPADIVLVLDHSGSMRTPAGAPSVLWAKNGVYNYSLYEGTITVPVNKLDTKLGQHTGYYVAQSQSSNAWFIIKYAPDFAGEGEDRWLLCNVPSTESIVDPNFENAEAAKAGGVYAEHTQRLVIKPEALRTDYPQLVFFKSQYAMLYDAVLDFVGDLKASGVQHRVAIVGFAGSESFGTGVYVGGDEDAFKRYIALYAEATTDERRNELYQKALKDVQNVTEYAELLSSVEAIETNHSFTCPSAGLRIANELYTANAVDPSVRDRIVVLFTDGIPNRQIGEDDGVDVDDAKQTAIYNEIVAKAAEVKVQGAQVYSISTTTLGEGADRTFLDYASSDYPDATSYTTPGEKVTDQYTFEIANAEGLNAAFTTIHQSSTTTSVTLDETAVLKEVLTDYFVLNPDDEVDVTVYTAAYDGKGSFAEKKEFTGATVSLSSSEGTGENARIDTIEVSGFDYSEEYVSNVARSVTNAAGETVDYYGSKLIVEVIIERRNGFWGGNNVPTNENTTGIYDKETVVEKFPIPEANVPVDVEITAKDKTIYYGGDVTTKELIDKVTAGGMDVTVKEDGTFTPQESWMDDYAEITWTENSTDITDPTDNPSNTTPGDYPFEVQITPKYPGEDNQSGDPGNIAGTPVDPDVGDTDSDTGKVHILVPEVTFKDSTTDFGTPTNGYDYEGNDLVENEDGETVIWVNMETGKVPGDEIPPVDKTTEPDITLTYTPEGGVTEFLEDTKVEVSITAKNPDGEVIDIAPVTDFKWEECDEPGHDDENQGIIDEHKANKENQHEFWVHVTLAIVPDTVVIDYGLPVDIDVLANDPKPNGIYPVLIGIGGKDQTTGFAMTSVPGSFGVLSANQDSTLRYTLNDAGTEKNNGMQMNAEEVFTYQVSYSIPDQVTKQLHTTVTVIPATTIYYEDTFLTFKFYDSTGSVNNSADHAWKAEGETVEGATQNQDRPDGAENYPDGVDADSIYGYDGAYTSMSEYSLGSAMKTTVSGAEFATAEFTFYGTGFDVVSFSGSRSGTILVDVFNPAEYAASGFAATPIKSFMVDTYYGYDFVDGQWVVVPDANEDSNYAGYQVPVMQVNNLPYGQYTAVISVYYAKTFDHLGAGEYDFYLDAIRIYDPANDGAGNQVIEDAYVHDNEGWPEYFELRNLVITADTFNSLGENEMIDGFVFIDGIPALNNDSASGSEGDITDTEDNLGSTENEENPVSGKSPAIVDYANFGPNNELYLAPGQGIAFKLSVGEYVTDENGEVTWDTSNIAGIHLAVKTVGGETEAKIFNANDNYEAVEGMDIKTATDLYYDITYLNNSTVVIANTGSNILSLTNIKITYKTEHVDDLEKSIMSISPEAAKMAINALVPIGSPDNDPADPAVVFQSYSISLNGDIGINVYAKLSDALIADADAKMTFTLADGTTQTVALSETYTAPAFGENVYVFTAKVAAKNMTDTITASMGGSSVSFSVKGYCDAMLAAISGNSSYAALEKLLKAMLNYGAYAQVCFGYNVENLANAGLTDTSLADVPDLSGYKPQALGSEEGIKQDGATLLLESTTTIRFFFTLTGEKTIDEYTFVVNGEPVKPVLREGKTYYVDMVNVAAKDLDVTYTVTVGGLRVKYSGLSYVYGAMGLTDATYQAVVNAAKALYHYNQAANAYFEG